jgi:hypothetical protein
MARSIAANEQLNQLKIAALLPLERRTVQSREYTLTGRLPILSGIFHAVE